MGILRDYIAYAREHVQPVLTDEAQQRLIQAYVDMRKVRLKALKCYLQVINFKIFFHRLVQEEVKFQLFLDSSKV